MPHDVGTTDLAERTAEEINAVRTEMSGLGGGPAGLPSYAPSDLVMPYDSGRSVFNFKGSNTQRTRRALTRAKNGEKMNILNISDSTMVGYDGTNLIEGDAIPDNFARILANAIDVPLAGSGIIPISASASLQYTNFAFTGTVDVSTYPGIARMSAGATITHTFHQRGTYVNVYYTDSSTAFSYTVDGGATQNVTPSGSGTGVSKHTGPSGLTNTTHTIVVTAASNYVYLLGVESGAASGIAMHNLALGGSRAGGTSPNSVNGWVNTASAPLNVNSARKGMFTASGITPDLVILCLGVNDITNSRTWEQTMADLTTIVGWYPNSDWLFVNTWNLRGLTPEPEWAEYIAERYHFAEDLDIPFLDWEAMYGNDDVTFNAGLAGPDGWHPDPGTQREMARSMAALYDAAEMGPDSKRVWSQVSVATLTINADYWDVATLTAQAAALTVAAPTGTPSLMQPLIITIKDNGTARAITWNAAFRAIGVTLPTTTVISKTHYIGCVLELERCEMGRHRRSHAGLTWLSPTSTPRRLRTPATSVRRGTCRRALSLGISCSLLTPAAAAPCRLRAGPRCTREPS